jgi:DNA-binding NarL/FixJ family response regulator
MDAVNSWSANSKWWQLWETAMQPNVFIIDIHMPLLNGLDAGQQISKLLPRTRLVYSTMNPDPDLAAEALRRGASGYLLKTSAASDILQAVRQVLKDELFISQGAVLEAIKDKPAALLPSTDPDPLTQRQREVLQLLAEGKVMKEAGDVLNLTARTVAFHKYRIMEALNITTNAEMVRYALTHHLLSA